MAVEVMFTVQAEVSDINVLVDHAKSLQAETVGVIDGVECLEFVRFVEAMADRRVFFAGSKGYVLLWGGIWNYSTFVGDFTDELAKLMRRTYREWLTNVIISWETEQDRDRRERILWFQEPAIRRKGLDNILVADVPRVGARWPWGQCSEDGPPSDTIMRIDGEPYPKLDRNDWCTCPSCCRMVEHYHWEGRGGGTGVRRCLNCGDEQTYIDVRIWKQKR